MLNLILASASPRRQELLLNAGIRFEVVVTDIDESRRPGEPAGDFCSRLAQEKAEAALNLVQGDPLRASRTILAADTIVVLAGDQEDLNTPILGKPTDASDSKRMLQALSGRPHRVMTAVCLNTEAPSGRKTKIAVETTTVYVNSISDREIDEYIATGEPLDKAGAYAIQGKASRWIPRIEGCYFNVVGLPVARVFEMLKELGTSAEALDRIGQ